MQPLDARTHGQRRLLLAGLCLAPLAAVAAAPLLAPAYITRELAQARLAGQGDFTWFGLDIYQARLWVGERGYLPGAPEAAPFVLELRYARALDGSRIADASFEQMKKIGAGSAAQRQAWLLDMRRIFPDVKRGQYLSGLYLPGAGARFYVDGALLAEVADAAFARAFFAIWLDPASTAATLRAALLLDAAPRP